MNRRLVAIPVFLAAAALFFTTTENHDAFITGILFGWGTVVLGLWANRAEITTDRDRGSEEAAE